jgi:NADH:ubiquinone oxidoreductase subunit 4 (subunit M)
MFAFVFFFIGFAIKIPTLPFHTWLPDAHVEAPTAVSVLLAGVLLKMGTYGLLRISFPMFPEATKYFAWPMALLGVAGIIYGAFVCMAQKDLKKLVAIPPSHTWDTVCSEWQPWDQWPVSPDVCSRWFRTASSLARSSSWSA